MSRPFFALTPEPPYYAVIFSSLRSQQDFDYACMAERLMQLAHQQPGFLGMESTRGQGGFGIAVSYWSSPAAIAEWKAHSEHLVAQAMGISTWYLHYEMRVAKVERAYRKPLK